MSTRSLRSTVAGVTGTTQASGSGSSSAVQVPATEDKMTDKTKAGKSGPQNSKKAKVVKQESPEDELAPLQLFLAMPLDIFATICTHLTTRDLLSLSLSAKVFRKPLAAPESGPGIWAAHRRAAELPIFKNMSEIAFAHLIDGENCTECGTMDRVKMVLDYRTRLCFKCRKSMFVTKAKLFVTMPELHPEAAECVLSSRYPPTEPSCQTRQIYLRKKDLERVNEELVPLQEDDDETEGTRQAVKLRRGTKSRQNTEFDAVEDVGKVEAFVAGKIAHFKIIAEETQAMRNAISENENRKRARAVEEARVQRALRTARYEDIKSRARTSMLAKGWTDTTFNQARKYTKRLLDDGKHKALEAAEWTSLEPIVVAKLEASYASFVQAEAYKTLLVAQQARKVALTTRFRLLRTAASAERKLTFPADTTFLALPEITALWENANSIINDATWAGVLPAVRAKIASRRQNLHRQAVCAILASKGFAPDAIDTEISDNHDSYSSACFDHVTSLFQDLQGNLRAYPAVLAHLDSYKKLASCKPALGTRILQKIVKAAGLGKSATVAQLDKLDPLLCFAEDPAQGAEYDWYSLYYVLYERYERKAANAAMTISLAT